MFKIIVLFFLFFKIVYMFFFNHVTDIDKNTEFIQI